MRKPGPVLIVVAVALLIGAQVRARNGSAANLPSLGDVLRISCVEGVLRFEWADELLGDLAPITVRGSEAQWKLSTIKPTAASMGKPGIGLDRLVGGGHATRHFWKVSITATAGHIRLSAMRSGRTPQETHFSMSQRADGSLRIVVIDKQQSVANTSAADLLELRRRHPRVVNDYLMPLLEQLGAADLLTPGGTDVYRVFTEIEPEPDLAAAVREVLPKLSASGFDEREAASNELRRLGPGAVLVLLRRDTTDDTPEARARIEKLLVESSRRLFDDPQAMRSDLRFLADCLDFQDERVRDAAMTRITQLTGWRVPPADWARPGDYVRGRILKSGR